MSPHAVGELVIKLFAAAGRTPPGRVDASVYEQVLAAVDDDEGAAALAELLTLADLRPTPGLVLEQVRTMRRRASERRPALPESTGGPASKETTTAWAAAARARLAGNPRPLGAGLTRVAAARPAGAHEFGDHDLCTPRCSAEPTDEEAAPVVDADQQAVPAESGR